MKQFVRVLCDIECTWADSSPVYRIYVDDELFAERTWKWTNEYLEEMLQIDAAPGEYIISFDLVNAPTATLRISNMRVDYGNGIILKDNMLRITK
tara:strand:- start:1619 stop:1903 length:285 start_codon:yes stop_codon:yes gene_type:complete